MSTRGAPVSGGGGTASDRKLLVMAGGDDEHVARAEGVPEPTALAELARRTLATLDSGQETR